MANFLASKESRSARSRNDLAAGYKNSFARIRALSERACTFVSPYACVERERDISSNRRVYVKLDDNKIAIFAALLHLAHVLSLSPIDEIHCVQRCSFFHDSIPSCEIPVSQVLKSLTTSLSKYILP